MYVEGEGKNNAPMRIRTADLMITSHALYQLSYESSYGDWPLVNWFLRVDYVSRSM